MLFIEQCGFWAGYSTDNSVIKTTDDKLFHGKQVCYWCIY